MVLAQESLSGICEGLKHNFLFNNDINSIHILLNLYDIESRMSNISPSYMSTSDIRKKVRKVLSHRKDRDSISDKIVMLIHEDIDRLELTFHLEGYTNGYYDSRVVNILEEETVKVYPIEKVYENSYLFHYDIPYENIEDLKTRYYKSMDLMEAKNNKIYNFMETYLNELIKSKIYRLNENLDKQLKVVFKEDNIYIGEEETFLSIRELNSIYAIILETVFENVIKIYKDASWFGVNDKLLNRY